MKYDYKYDINESGMVTLKELPFTNRYVEIPREEQFRKLYSYVLIDIDINYALSFLELCTQTVNDIERQCFFRMAVIQYSKCYSPSKNGGRSQLDAARVYKDLPDDPIGCHAKYIEMRNKYFAHDEKDFKASKLGAVLNIDEQKMVGIAYPRMQAKFDYDPTIAILKELCEKTREWVCIKLDEEIDRVSQYIEQRGFDVLNEYEDLRVFD
ncbi:MAG: hypothetical protein IJI75_06185 [Solobacterium sp.]|nr:hypothetical protein [Solobacterium sp.]